MRHRLTRFGQLDAKRAALFCLLVETLRNWGRSASFTEQQDVDLKFPAVVLDAQMVADVNIAGWLRGLSIRLDPAEFAGAGG